MEVFLHRSFLLLSYPKTHHPILRDLQPLHLSRQPVAVPWWKANKISTCGNRVSWTWRWILTFFLPVALMIMLESLADALVACLTPWPKKAPDWNAKEQAKDPTCRNKKVMVSLSSWAKTYMPCKKTTLKSNLRRRNHKNTWQNAQQVLRYLPRGLRPIDSCFKDLLESADEEKDIRSSYMISFLWMQYKHGIHLNASMLSFKSKYLWDGTIGAILSTLREQSESYWRSSPLSNCGNWKETTDFLKASVHTN